MDSVVEEGEEVDFVEEAEVAGKFGPCSSFSPRAAMPTAYLSFPS